MAVDQEQRLDERIIPFLRSTVYGISDRDHVNFACCPATKTRTVEYLAHYIKEHTTSLNLPDAIPTSYEFTLKGKDADAYRERKARVADSIKNNYYVEDPEWDTELVLDTNTAEYNQVTLKRVRSQRDVAQMLRSYFTSRSEPAYIAEVRHALNHEGTFCRDEKGSIIGIMHEDPELDEFMRQRKCGAPHALAPERPDLIMRTYQHSDALAVVGKRYTVDEAAELYDNLFDSALVTYMAIDTAFGMEKLAKHVGKHENVEGAARVFNALHGEKDLFSFLEQSHGTLAAITFTNTHFTLEKAWEIYERALNPTIAFMFTYAGFGKDAALQHLAAKYATPEAAAIINATLPEDERWHATETAFKDRLPALTTLPAEEMRGPMPGGAGPMPEGDGLVYK